MKKEQEYNFYYSKKQEEKHKELSFIHSKRIIKFKGNVYTEMQKVSGNGSNWDDAILLGIGTDSDIEVTNKTY